MNSYRVRIDFNDYGQITSYEVIVHNDDGYPELAALGLLRKKFETRGVRLSQFDGRLSVKKTIEIITEE